MTMLFFEGFETVGTETLIANEATVRPRINLRWTTTGSGGAPSTDSFFLIDDIFSEGFAIQMGSNNFSNGNFLRWVGLPTTTTGASAAEYILGFRVHIPSTSRTFNIAQIRTQANNSPHLHISCTNSADVAVNRNLGGNFFSGTDAFTPGNWHYVELRFIIGNSPYGEVQLFVDGIEIGETLSTDTEDFFGHVDSFQLQTTNASTGEDYVGFDDIYCLEVDGSAPNDFISLNTRIISRPPDGDDTTQWTPSAGTTHYTLIDENGADTADSISHGTNGERDLFTVTDISEGAVIHSVKIEAEALDLATGVNNIDVECKNNATTAQTNHNVTSTTAYAVFDHYQDTDPNTGSAWTNAGFDTMKCGVQYNT